MTTDSGSGILKRKKDDQIVEENKHPETTYLADSDDSNEIILMQLNNFLLGILLSDGFMLPSCYPEALLGKNM